MPASPLPSRASVWEWAQTALLVGNLGWTTLCLGGYRPETLRITSALNGLLLVVHLLGRALGGDGSRRSHPAGWWLLPFLAYAAGNVLWLTPVPWLGWWDWLGWAQLILVFWVVLNGVRATATRTVLLGGLVAVASVAAALACYQRFVRPDWLMLGRTQADQFIGRSSGSFGIPNSLAALLLLLLPLLAVLALRRDVGGGRRVLGGVLAAGLALGLVLTVSRGAGLALGLVLAAWPLVAARGSRWRRAGLTALATLGVVAACGALYWSVPKVRERGRQLVADAGEVTRPIMWRGAWQIFRAHPAVGGGAGSYNVLFEAHRPGRYQDEPRWAHNDYLNTLSDYGAVGFALFFGVGGLLAWRAGRGRAPRQRDWLDEPRVAGALVAGGAAFGLQLFVDFHLKIPALAMAVATVAALLVQRAWPEDEAPAPATRAGRAGALLVALAVTLAVIGWVEPYYRGEALRYAARQSLNRLAAGQPSLAEQRATLERARADLGRAVQVAPANAQAWSDLAYATSLGARVEPARAGELGRAAEAAARRALGLSAAVPEFWLRCGVALDMQGRRAEGGAALVQALVLAPASANVWFYHSYHLSLNSGDPGLALAAVETCLRLDPDNAEAQLLRHRLVAGRRAP